MAEGRRARRPPLLPLAIIVAFVAVAVLAGVASPADPYAQHLRSRLAPPIWSPDGSWQHPLGTDRLGRDLLSRLFYGARVSLAAGVVTVALAGAVGGGVGLVAGYLRGRTGALLMRVTDATLAFPIILLALVLAVTLGPSFSNVVVAIAVILWARYARVIYGEVVALMERDFIAQARALGASPVRIIAFHLFP
ncbi:MAG: peptide ABC transporter permease, partial [Candidatus Rokuibacteriota bacterium]